MTRAFLGCVGALYLGLALWCSFAPAETSAKVGFTLEGGSGSSEFLTVYGGLEFGLALLLLIPVVRPQMATYSLLACLLIHGSLVAFRSASFVLYSGFEPMTPKLAVGEWVIFLLSLTLWLRSARDSAA